MKINSLNNIYLTYKGKRDENNYVNKLSNGNEPINENLRINILNALNSMSQNSSIKNINFLLSTREKLNYGIRENSKFKKLLLEQSILREKNEISNTNWDNKLKETIQNAIRLNKTNSKEALEKKFEKIYSTEIPLTQAEEEILNFRTKILKSISAINFREKGEETSKIQENLDYFIASSEISKEEKLNCLEQIKEFLSSKYKINPQLRGKKTQILSEILNDIIIKTPEDARLKIKEVDQKRHGMCAAIAACRKLAAYQDKRNYLKNIFSELSASAYMKIYDITQLGTGKKIPVKKAIIDFEDALKRGYRIIDASALQWMQHSARSGDGTIKNENYIAFDAQNYEIFKDSFWLSNFPAELAEIRLLLMYLIKARAFATDVEKTMLNNKILTENHFNNRNKLLNELSRKKRLLETILEETIPNKPREEIIKLSNLILDLENKRYNTKSTNNLEKTKNAKYKIDPQEPNENKKKKISALIREETQISESKIKENIDKIFSIYEAVNICNNELDLLKKASKPEQRIYHYIDLFNFAAAYRKAIETNLLAADYIFQLSNEYNIPNREDIIKGQLKLLENEIRNTQNRDIIKYYSQILQTSEDKSALLEKLSLFNNGFQSSISSKFEEICKDLGVESTKGLLRRMLETRALSTEINDKEDIADLAEIFKTKANSFAVARKIKNLLEELEQKPTEETFSKIFNYFQIKDRTSFIENLSKSIYNIINYPNLEYEPSSMFNLAENIIEGQDDINNLKKKLPYILKKAKGLQTHLETIEEFFQVPNTKDLILCKLEREGEILSKRELDYFDRKFLEIVQFNNLKNNIDSNEEKQKDIRKYLLSNEGKEAIKKIQKNFFRAKRYINRSYEQLNNFYAEDLDEIYREIGRGTGRFWIPEEGFSGMSDSEVLKIIEQITGKPYHIEHDFLKAIKAIKSGNGGGEITTDIMDNEFSGHAQFIPSITTERYKDSETGETKLKEIVWHDNSWGKTERQTTWRDKEQFLRTNYNNGTGGANGFIVRDNDMIGWETDYMLYGKGINHPEQIYNTRTKRLYDSVGTEYSLFRSIIMPGGTTKSEEDASEIIKNIFNKNKNKIYLTTILNRIEKGEYPEIEKYGEKIDKEVENSCQNLAKRIKEIKSEEEFNNLSEKDELKIIFNKIAITKTAIGARNKELINSLKTLKEIESYNNELLNKLKRFTLSYLGKDAKLLNSNSLQEKYEKYIIDFCAKNKYSLKGLKKSLKNIGQINSEDISNLYTLKRIFIKRIEEAIDKNVKIKTYTKKIKEDLIKISNEYFENTYSARSIISNNNFKPILKYIDNKFNPYDNAEAENIVKKLRTKSKEELEKMLENAQLKDFGIEYTKPYHYLKLFKSENYSAINTFNNAAFAHFINLLLPEYKKPKITLGTEFEPLEYMSSTSVNAYFRELYTSLSYIEVAKEIKKQKAEALREYSLREAFPHISNFNTEAIHEPINSNIKLLNTLSLKYTALKNLKELIIKLRKIEDFMSKNKKLFAQDYEEVILPNLKEIHDSAYKSELGIEIINIIEEIIHTSSGDINKLTNLLTKLKNEFNKINKDLNEEAIEKSKENCISGIKKVTKTFAKKFILPSKKQNEFEHILHKYINENLKHNNKITMEKNLADIHNFVDKYCFTKNPSLLLKELIKIAIENNKNKTNKDSDLISTYSETLISQLEAANLTELEFKILDTVNSGTIYDFKKHLEKFPIYQNDGSITTLNTEEGMLALFNALYNSSNQGSIETINLLCKHTGLAEDIYKALIKNTNFNEYNKEFSNFERNMLKGYQATKTIDEIFSTINIGVNDELKNITHEYTEKLSKHFANNNLSSIFKIYLKEFQNFSKIIIDIENKIKENDFDLYKQKKLKIMKKLFKLNHQKALNTVIMSLDKHIEKFNINMDSLFNDINILEKLEISKFSDAYKSKKENIEMLEKLYKKNEKLSVKIPKKIDKFFDESITENIHLNFDEM